MGRIEVRGFGDLKKLFDERRWPFPLEIELPEETSGAELAARLGLPADKIEAVFINGIARGIEYPVKPGDRVAFVPPGTPGPYRVVLGIARQKEER